MAAGRDFHLAFSPERIDPGRTDVHRAHDAEAGRRAQRGLHRAGPGALLADLRAGRRPLHARRRPSSRSCWRTSSARSTSPSSTSWPSSATGSGVDVWEVIDAASTKPFGFMRFEPGPGMGGHCLPVDPFYLAFKAREHDFYPEFIELAGKINQAQPQFCVDRIEKALNGVRKAVNGSRILILGVSYKAGVGDTREAPALQIIRMLRDLGARRRLPRPPRPLAGRVRALLGRPRRRGRRRRPGRGRHRPPGDRLREAGRPPRS